MKSVTPMVIALSFLVFQGAAALADDASPPQTTATRPAKDLPGQTSIPSTASPPTRTETTGSTNQDPTTKKMNADAKKKLEIEGK